MGGEEGWSGVGAPTGALSHDDILKQIRPGRLVAAHTFVSGHSLFFPLFTYSTKTR